MIVSSLAIIALAALIHTSFQLNVSVLTLLSSHAIGKKQSHYKVLRLTSGFLLGALLTTTLLVSLAAFTFQALFNHTTPPLLWAVACGSLLGLGVSVWVFYYRRERGTTLWLPRNIARLLAERSKNARHSSEAFGLGAGSVVGELLFVAVPIVIAGLALIQLEPTWQIVGLLLYCLVSLGSLFVVFTLIGSGHTLSQIQRWREQNKRFLQIAGGSGLFILGFYVYVDQVLATTVQAQGGF